MMHPYVIDTSVIYNITGNRFRKTKLALLAQKFLGEEIQQGKKGHCSVEDSSSCMKLAQLKLANGMLMWLFSVVLLYTAYVVASFNDESLEWYRVTTYEDRNLIVILISGPYSVVVVFIFLFGVYSACYTYLCKFILSVEMLSFNLIYK